MFDIRKYLENAPKEISDFILGKKNKCNYKDDFYNYEKLGKDIIKYTGVDSIYTQKVLKIILDNNKIHFSDVLIHNFKWNKKGINLLIKIVSKIDLSMQDLVSILIIHPNFKNISSNFFKFLYYTDKELLKNIFKGITDSDVFIDFIPYLLGLDYRYYNKRVKKHLIQYLKPLLLFNTSYFYHTRLYDFLKDLKEEDFKDKFILVYLSRWIKRPILDSDEIILTKDMRYSILRYVKLGHKDKHWRSAMAILSRSKKELKKFSVFFLPNTNMTPFEKRIFLLSVMTDLFSYYNLLPKGRVTHFNEFLNEYDKNDLLEAIELIPNSQQKIALEKLFGFNKKIAYQFLLDILPNAKSKALKLEIVNQAVNYFSENKKVKDDFIKLQTSKSVNVREIAIKVLMNIQEDEVDMGRIIEFLDNEENTQIGRVISNFLDKEEVTFADFKGSTTLNTLLYSKEWFVHNASKAKKPNFKWLDVNILPKLYYLDDNHIIGLKELYQFINVASTITDFSNIMLIEKYGILLRKKDLVLFSIEMYRLWNKDSKRRWTLSFIATFGDESVVDIIKNDILRFLENKENTYAAKLIDILGRIATPNALELINYFSNFNIKQIKNVSFKSLDIAAKKLGIFKDDILDDLIPNFGFDNSYILKIEDREFELIVNSNLSIAIMEGGKELKKIPTYKNPSKKVKNSIEKYKELKNKIRKESKKQIKRLENALIQKRVWSYEKWQKVFIKNPIMNQLSKSLIWGTYNEDGDLIKVFRVTEDNLVDIEDKKISIDKNNTISLLHPIELKKEVLIKWQNILKNKKIEQPFSQLNRKVFYLDSQKNGDDYSIDFENIILEKNKLNNFFSKKGWIRRDIKSGFCKYGHYKKFEYYKIGVVIYFGGRCNTCQYYKLNQIPLTKVVFYAVHGDKYDLNDEVIERKYLTLSKVPQVIYSEVLFQVNELIDSLDILKEVVGDFDLLIE